MKQITKTACYFILFLSTVSCLSTTTIRAVNKKGEIDKDVKIYVDYNYIGNGEVAYSDRSTTVYSPLPVLELKKEGCHTKRENLATQINWINNLSGAVIGGIGIWMLLPPYSKLSLLAGVPDILAGLPVTIAGITISTFGKEYIPVQQHDFSCLKITE